MNPIEFIKGIKNPEQFIMNTVKQNSNPMIEQLMKMAKSGNTKEVETFARNTFKQQGRDFDKEFANFMRQIKG